MSPRIRIELDLGEEQPTWVTVSPISMSYVEGQLHYAVVEAAGKAFVGFMRSICRESEEAALNEHLASFKREWNRWNLGIAK